MTKFRKVQLPFVVCVLFLSVDDGKLCFLLLLLLMLLWFYLALRFDALAHTIFSPNNGNLTEQQEFEQFKKFKALAQSQKIRNAQLTNQAITSIPGLPAQLLYNYDLSALLASSGMSTTPTSIGIGGNTSSYNTNDQSLVGRSSASNGNGSNHQSTFIAANLPNNGSMRNLSSGVGASIGPTSSMGSSGNNSQIQTPFLDKENNSESRPFIGNNSQPWQANQSQHTTINNANPNAIDPNVNTNGHHQQNVTRNDNFIPKLSYNNFSSSAPLGGDGRIPDHKALSTEPFSVCSFDHNTSVNPNPNHSQTPHSYTGNISINSNNITKNIINSINNINNINNGNSQIQHQNPNQNHSQPAQTYPGHDFITSTNNGNNSMPPMVSNGGVYGSHLTVPKMTGGDRVVHPMPVYNTNNGNNRNSMMQAPVQQSPRTSVTASVMLNECDSVNNSVNSSNMSSLSDGSFAQQSTQSFVHTPTSRTTSSAISNGNTGRFDSQFDFSGAAATAVATRVDAGRIAPATIKQRIEDISVTNANEDPLLSLSCDLKYGTKNIPPSLSKFNFVAKPKVQEQPLSHPATTNLTAGTSLKMQPANLSLSLDTSNVNNNSDIGSLLDTFTQTTATTTTINNEMNGVPAIGGVGGIGWSQLSRGQAFNDMDDANDTNGSNCNTPNMASTPATGNGSPIVINLGVGGDGAGAHLGTLDDLTGYDQGTGLSMSSFNGVGNDDHSQTHSHQTTPQAQQLIQHHLSNSRHGTPNLSVYQAVQNTQTSPHPQQVYQQSQLQGQPQNQHQLTHNVNNANNHNNNNVNQQNNVNNINNVNTTNNVNNLNHMGQNSSVSFSIQNATNQNGLILGQFGMTTLPGVSGVNGQIDDNTFLNMPMSMDSLDGGLAFGNVNANLNSIVTNFNNNMNNTGNGVSVSANMNNGNNNTVQDPPPRLTSMLPGTGLNPGNVDFSEHELAKVFSQSLSIN